MSCERIEAVVGAKIVRTTPLSGGCVAEVRRLDLADGRRLVMKERRAGQAPLALEGRMLRELECDGHLPVPHVHLAEDDILVLDFVEHDATGLDARAQAHAGALIGALHAVPRASFGFGYDTLIGPLHQPNPTSDRWIPFFAEHRLLQMARVAHAADRLPSRTLGRLERLAERLERYLDEPAHPSLLHGDLWAGNLLAKDGRMAAFIDPAIYYGHPEIELAFATLFGSLGEPFFDAYREHSPLAPDFFELRRDLYNLYPLLVHIRLFGQGYLSPIERTLARVNP